jgi:hypothetical protein
MNWAQILLDHRNYSCFVVEKHNLPGHLKKQNLRKAISHDKKIYSTNLYVWHGGLPASG